MANLTDEEMEGIIKDMIASSNGTFNIPDIDETPRSNLEILVDFEAIAEELRVNRPNSAVRDAGSLYLDGAELGTVTNFEFNPTVTPACGGIINERGRLNTTTGGAELQRYLDNQVRRAVMDEMSEKASIPDPPEPAVKVKRNIRRIVIIEEK